MCSCSALDGQVPALRFVMPERMGTEAGKVYGRREWSEAGATRSRVRLAPRGVVHPLVKRRLLEALPCVLLDRADHIPLVKVWRQLGP